MTVKITALCAALEQPEQAEPSVACSNTFACRCPKHFTHPPPQAGTSMQVDRKVLEEAIAALEDACGGRCNAEYNPCWQQEVAQTLKAALEQPEQEPVAWRYEIATRKAKGGEYHGWESRLSNEEPCAPVGAIRNSEPLYTHSPRREWRGLTEEDMIDIQDRCGVTILRDEFLAIEAALKEKNHE